MVKCDIHRFGDGDNGDERMRLQLILLGILSVVLYSVTTWGITRQFDMGMISIAIFILFTIGIFMGKVIFGYQTTKGEIVVDDKEEVIGDIELGINIYNAEYDANKLRYEILAFFRSKGINDVEIYGQKTYSYSRK
jgi:hypothetical protein